MIHAAQLDSVLARGEVPAMLELMKCLADGPSEVVTLAHDLTDVVCQHVPSFRRMADKPLSSQVLWLVLYGATLERQIDNLVQFSSSLGGRANGHQSQTQGQTAYLRV